MSSGPTGSEDARDLAEYASTRAPDAFERLANRYANVVFAACLRRLGSREDAEDASQAVFAALAMKAASVKPRHLLSWLHGTAMRTAAFMARTRARRARHEEEAARMKPTQVETPPEPGPDPAVLRARLDAELERLPAKLREAVTRHYLAGQSHAELARALGIPEGTAASRVGAGLEKLRRRLAGRGVSLGASALSAALLSEANVTAPAGFLSSLPALATAASATGAVTAAGAAAIVLAKGVLKMVFWEQVRLTSAALLCAGAVAGLSGLALEVSTAPRTPADGQPPLGADESGAAPVATPRVDSTGRVLKGRVTYVRGKRVYISLGLNHGISTGFSFSCRAKGWTGTVVDCYQGDGSILRVTGGQAEVGDEVQTGYAAVLAVLEKSNSREREPGMPAASKPIRLEGLDVSVGLATGPSGGAGWFCLTPAGRIIDNVAHLGQIPDGSKYYRHFVDTPSASIRNNGSEPKIVSTGLSAGCGIRSFLKDLSGKVLATSEWKPRKLMKGQLPEVAVLMPGQAVELAVPLHVQPDVLFKSGIEEFDRTRAARARRTAERMRKMMAEARKRGVAPAGPASRWARRDAYRVLPRGWYLLSVEVDLGAGGTVAGGARIIGGKVTSEDFFFHLGARSRMLGIKRGRGVKDSAGKWILR
jgi:RNA polymerase sigma factor (sigma-70 family)